MYCVCEVDSNNKKTITDLFVDKDRFVSIVNDKLKKTYEFKQLDNFDMSKFNTHPNGYYLVNNNDKLSFVEKKENISKGYLFNSVYHMTVCLFNYELIPFSVNIGMIQNNFLDDDETSETEELSVTEDTLTTEDTLITEDTSITEDISCTNDRSENSVAFTESEEEECFNVDECLLENMCDNPVIYICSDNNKERTNMIGNLIDSLSVDRETNTFMLIISSTSSELYRTKYPEAEVLSYYDEKAVNDYIYEHNKQTFIVLDNCIASNHSYDNLHAFRELINNSKKNNITLIMGSHFPEVYTYDVRKSFDYVFIGSLKFDYQKGRIYDVYAEVFPTYDLFLEQYKKVDNFLVVSNKIEDNENPVGFYNL